MLSRVPSLCFIRPHLATSVDQPPELSFSCAVALTISAQFGIDIIHGLTGSLLGLVIIEEFRVSL